MARVRISMPATYQYCTTLTVEIGHINYGGHLGNDSLLSILHEARLRFLNSLGYSETDIEGQGMIMVDAAVEYRAESFRGDRLRVAMAVSEPGGRGFDLVYLVHRLSDGREVARAKTGILFFDYTKRQVGRTPAGFEARLARLAPIEPHALEKPLDSA